MPSYPVTAGQTFSLGQVSVHLKGQVTPAYQGLGDTVGVPAEAYFGMRAYSAATRGTPCCRIWRDDDQYFDINTDAVTGIMDTAQLTSIMTGHTSYGVCVFYDQTGNGHHATANGGGWFRAADMTKCNGKPAFNFSTYFGFGANGDTGSGVTPGTDPFSGLGGSSSDPMTLLMTFLMETQAANDTAMWWGNNGIYVSTHDGQWSADGHYIYASGGNLLAYATAHPSNGAWHSGHYLWNGNSSKMFVDGADLTTQNDSTGWSFGVALNSSSFPSSNSSTNGKALWLAEAAFYRSAVTADKTALSKNFYGF